MFVLPHVGSSLCRRKEDWVPWKTGEEEAPSCNRSPGWGYEALSLDTHHHTEKMNVSAYLPHRPDVSIRWNRESERVLLVIRVGEFYFCGHKFNSDQICVFFPWRDGHLWTVCFWRSNLLLPWAVPFPHQGWSLISARGLPTLPFSLGLAPKAPPATAQPLCFFPPPALCSFQAPLKFSLFLSCSLYSNQIWFLHVLPTHLVAQAFFLYFAHPGLFFERQGKGFSSPLQIKSSQKAPPLRHFLRLFQSRPENLGWKQPEFIYLFICILIIP